MKKLRIALAEVSGKPRINIYASVRTSRGVPFLAAVLQEIGYQPTCFVESIQGFKWRELMDFDVIGFGALSCTIVQTHTMIRQLRAAGYRGKIIVGGPHATEAANDSLLAGADVVVRNEGDNTIVELMRALEAKKPLTGIEGITWIDEDGVIHANSARPLLTEEELSNLPLPAFDSIKGYEHITVIPFSFSRGCPNVCDFCGVAKMFGHKYRASSVEWRISQLRQFKAKCPVLWATKPLFFTDDNFIGTFRTKKITIEFLHRMITEDLVPPKGYVCQMRVTDVTPEIADLLKATNCTTVCLGIESVDDATLELLKKQQTKEDVRVGLAMLHRAGLKTLAMTIVGSDTDTFLSSWRSIRQLRDWGITFLQVLALTPLIGTCMTLRFQKEGRRYSLRYENQDGMCITFKSEHMSKLSVWAILYLVGFFWFYGDRVFGRNPMYRRFVWQWILREFKNPWTHFKLRFLR